MKTLQKNFNKNTTRIVIVSILLVMLSCQNQEKKAENQITENPVSQTKPPALDIHAATFMGNLEAIEQHIKAGTDLNQKDQFGSSPLAIAATFNKIDVANALLEAGVDISTKSGDGSTPLHTAAFFCRLEIVNALLAKGADKAAINNFDSTPLESVSGPFNEVKPIYDQISKDLGPFGFKLDYKYLETTRPIIAELLK